MKRAIYVGDDDGLFKYGTTGTVRPWGIYVSGTVNFLPDGETRGGWLILRKDLYIPSEDQTRHCPKP
jgi:hypothetical protein